MKNPLKISAAYNDDLELNAELEAVAESWGKQISGFVTHHKAIAGLEITAREKTLHGKFFDVLYTIALGLVVEGQIRNAYHGCMIDRN